MKRSVPGQNNKLFPPSLTAESGQDLALWNLSLVLKEIAEANASEAGQVGEGHGHQKEIKKPPPPSLRSPSGKRQIEEITHRKKGDKQCPGN